MTGEPRCSKSKYPHRLAGRINDIIACVTGSNRYRGALAGSVQEILTVLERVCGERDARALLVLHRLAHNLNGASSLMGYLELSRAARTSEQQVGMLIPLQGQQSLQELGELNQLTAALCRADPTSPPGHGNRGEVYTDETRSRNCTKR